MLFTPKNKLHIFSRKIAPLFLSLALLLPGTAFGELRNLPSVTVLAASSLTDALTELIGIYAREKGITVSASYDSSSVMALQIIEGESADIFISAHPVWMTELKQRGLIDVFTLTNLAKNRLVVAASTKNKLDTLLLQGKPVKTILKAITTRTIPVIADPADVPLGMYTKETLVALGMWKKLENNAIRTSSARHALYLIAKGQSVGITYLTDAIGNPEVTILAPIDDSLHSPIVYQAAVVAGENMQQARDFLDFLKSDKAIKVFEKYHFIMN